MTRIETIGRARLILGIKPVVACRQCDTTWRTTGLTSREDCPGCGKKKDVRHRKGPSRPGNIKEWRASRPGYSTEWERRYRRRALLVVGNGTVACVRCGCDRPELIEINHKNGGGGKELRGLGSKWHRVIAKLERDTAALELLCRPCNAIHYLETQHGPLPFRVIWEGK